MVDVENVRGNIQSSFQVCEFFFEVVYEYTMRELKK